MIINPTNDSDQFEDNFDLTSTGIILTNPTLGTSQFIGNFNIQTETEASIANPTSPVSSQFADNFNLPDNYPNIGIANNPTISTSQQFADNFNLPDTNPQIGIGHNPTISTSQQFADNFNLPDANPIITVTNNPTLTPSQQFADNFNLPDANPIIGIANNPTNPVSGQFADNFNLPDANPTVTVTNNPTTDIGQFGDNFNLPDATPTIVVANNPTTTNNDQFGEDFDLTTTTETNIAANNPNNLNPTTTSPGQFGEDFDLTTTTETNIVNPTSGIAGIGLYYQPFDYDTTTETNIAANNPNPTLGGILNQSLQATIPPDFSPIGNNEPANKVAPNAYTNQNKETYGSDLIKTAVLTANGILGIPQAGQSVLAALRNLDTPGSSNYTTSPMDKLTLKYPAKSGNAGDQGYFPAAYVDFRARNGEWQQMRLDGTSAAIRNLVYGEPAEAIKPGLYAASNVAAALSPIPIGPYSLFNLDGTWKSGYGWGSHDARFALRLDFTLQSQVARSFINNPDATLNTSPNKDHKTMILNQIFPFRGDRVNVIDYGKRPLKRAMNWRPNPLSPDTPLPPLFSDTQDLIKFYFTGPTLFNGNEKLVDDIIVFRAALNSLTDSFNANWNTVNMIGRADPNYQYTGYSRDVNLGFNVVATDRDELRVIYRKLNALAGYTAPTYNESSIAMEAPWLRLTVGDVFQQTPVVLNTLSYTFETDYPWEINIENDFEMMQAPLHVSVTCGFNIIGDSIPQKSGRFYGFAKNYNKNTGQPQLGRGNWLSDSKNNVPSPLAFDNTIVDED